MAHKNIPLGDSPTAQGKRPPQPAQPRPLAAVRLSNSHLLPGRQTVWAQVDLTAPKSAEKERDPVDVAPVLDCSGSMGQGPGSPRAHAFEAARYVLARLGGQDRSALVLYASDVQVAKRLDADHQKAIDLLARSTFSGMTALAPGLYAGIEQLAPKKGRSQCVFLLSDGLANVGDTDPEVIAATVKKAAEAGVKVSTFGLGAQYDEDLLETLATAGGGGYYYLASADDAPRAFAEELEGLLQITARQAVIDLRPAAGVTVKRLLGLEATTSPVQVGDLPAEATRTLLVELELDGQAGEQDLLEVVLTYDDLNGQGQLERQSLTLTVDVDQALVSAGVDAGVLAKVAEMEAAYAQAEAAKLADRGDFAAAQNLIGGARQRVASVMGASPLAASLLSGKASELDDNLQWFSSQATYTAEAAKMVKSSSYSTRSSRPRSAPPTPSR